MPERKKTSQNKQNEVKQQRRLKQQKPEPLSEGVHDHDEKIPSMTETPFHARINEHAALLSRIPFKAQRDNFIQQLHQTYGNKYVQRLIESINVQAKLTVSDPNDIYEQEADRVADEVTRAISSPVQRQEEEEELLQGKSLIQRQTPEEEEELLQGKSLVQRQTPEEEEELQMQEEEEEELEMKASQVQRQEDEEELQMQKEEADGIKDVVIGPYHVQSHDIGGGNLAKLQRAIDSHIIQRVDMATCEACGQKYDMDEHGETCPYCGATEPLVNLEHAIRESKKRLKGPNTGVPDMATCEACGKEYDMDKYGETCPYCGKTEPIVSLRHARLQAKLTVSDSNDIYEREADRVADEVTRAVDSQAQRQTPEEEEELLQGKSLAQRQTKAVSEEVEASINNAKGGGQPLSDVVREPMEQAFGADFSGVRIHTDSEADALNQQLSARAFTTGQDVFFREGEYSPGSDSGKMLIAHELTHVVQQAGQVKETSKKSPSMNTTEPNEQIHSKSIENQIQRLIDKKGKNFDLDALEAYSYSELHTLLMDLKYYEILKTENERERFWPAIRDEDPEDLLKARIKIEEVIKKKEKATPAPMFILCSEGEIKGPIGEGDDIDFGGVTSCMAIRVLGANHKTYIAHIAVKFPESWLFFQKLKALAGAGAEGVYVVGALGNWQINKNDCNVQYSDKPLDDPDIGFMEDVGEEALKNYFGGEVKLTNKEGHVWTADNEMAKALGYGVFSPEESAKSAPWGSGSLL